jgi:hypothetical protein
MAYSSIKRYSFFIIIIFILINKTTSQGIPEEGRLKDLKRDVEYLETQAEINKTVIYGLIGTIIFFLIVIIALSTYEIINCYLKKKDDFLKKTIIINKMRNSLNSKNENIAESGASFPKEEKKNLNLNSFHSSKYSESYKSKENILISREDFDDNDNNDKQKSNLDENNNFRERINSGYVAPAVQNDDNGEILMTNGYNNDKSQNNNIHENPY